MTNPICPRCRTRPRRDGQGYCDECIALYRLEYRRDQVEAHSDEDSIYAKTVLPKNLFHCWFCGNPRQAYPNRPDYGQYFESQAEANQCCEHGETHTVPRVTEEYGLEHGYAPVLTRTLLGAQLIQNLGQTHRKVATKYLPTLHHGVIGDSFN